MYNDGAAVLNVGGTEWIIIIFVALILILGTGKLPGAARKIGRAVNEYNKAKDGIEDHIKQIQGATDNAPKITGPVESEREKLEVMARAIGLNPDDKNDAELQKAISDKMDSGGSAQTSKDDSNSSNNSDADDSDSAAPGKHVTSSSASSASSSSSSSQADRDRHDEDAQKQT